MKTDKKVNIPVSDRSVNESFFEIEPRQDRLLTVAEVGQILSLSIFTVYGLASEGRLPRVKIGRCVRFRYSDIRNLMNS